MEDETTTNEVKKARQDYHDIVPILLTREDDFSVSKGRISIHINHGSNRQLVLGEDGKWMLN